MDFLETDSSGLDTVSDQPLNGCETSSTGLDIDKDDLPQGLRQPKSDVVRAIEHDEVDWATEETNVRRIKWELERKRRELLTDLAG